MNTGLHLVFIVCSAFFVLVFALYLLLQAAFILAWLRIPAEKESQKKLSTRLAVILPVRNEAANLEACLKSIAEQNYSPDLFELIVADDDSEDKTAEIVKAFIASGQIRNMKYIHLPGDPEVKAHKKRAIAAGIRQTDADLIVTTDGDCVSGKNWLRAIVTFYECEAPALIIGPVAFRDEQSLFEQMQTLEFAGLLLVTGASSALGIPLMCSGANLAYPRTFFEGVKGYEGDEEASGDDVLLLKRIAQKYPGAVRFLKSSPATVFTSAQKTLPAFLEQRKRWSSKFKKYGSGPIAGVAVLVFLCNLLFLTGGLIGIFVPAFGCVYLILAAAKLIIDFLILFLATSFTNRKKLLWIYLPELFFYSFYVVLTAVLGLKTEYSWKGRKNEQARAAD